MESPDHQESAAQGEEDQIVKESFTSKLITRLSYLALLLVAGGVIYLVFFAGATDTPEDLGETLALDSEFLTKDGQAETLRDQLGKPLVVNFYSSTCAPCRAELPDFDSVFLQVQDDVDFLGINLDTTESTWRIFDEEVPVSYETVFQPEKEIFNEVEAKGMPTTLFLDSDGQILKRWGGALDDDALIDIIETEFGV